MRDLTFEQCMDLASDAVYLIDRDLRFVFVNLGACRALGYSREELLTLSSPDIDPDISRERASEMMAQLLAAGRQDIFETRHRTRDGRIFPVEISVSMFEHQGERFSLCIAHDISRRKRMEDSLRFSNSVLSAQLEVSPDGILVVGTQGEVLSSNRRFAEIWNIPRDLLEGGTSGQLIPLAMERLEDPGAFVDKVRFLYDHPDLESQDELRFKDGRILERHSAPVRTEQGRCYGRIWHFRDITSRRRAEELQRSLDAEKFQFQKLDSLGSLASGVAHDMNNVLAAIQAVSETVGALRGEDEELLGLLRIIDAASSRGRELATRLTNFARKDVREPEVLDLNVLVQEELDLLARSTFQKVSLAVDLQEGLPLVMAERSSVSSALMNLCLNAVDAMPSGGTLTLRTRSRPGGQVEIQVQDTGQGMSEAVLSRALEPFFTTKPIGKGTGMGLSMAYATLKAHGGRLHIRSREGEGTLVTLVFPGMIQEEDPVEAPCGEAGFQRPLKVLLVDDDELVLASVPGMIGTLGHAVTAASGGVEALTLLEAGERFDAIVLDLNMPGMNGLEFLGLLRERQPTLPVIMGTGFLDETTAAALKQDPWVCPLLKPYSRRNIGQKLLEAVRSAGGP